jgi:hypothetical protein
LTGNLQLCAWLPAVLNPRRNPIWSFFICHKLLRLLTPFCLAGVTVGLIGMLLSVRTGPLVLAAGLVVLVVLLVGLPGGRARQLRDGFAWGWAMQLAALAAWGRALRGRWDAWDRPT